MDIDFKKYNLGMKRDGSVILMDHQESWAQCFALASKQLRAGLLPFNIELHHIGSTSVSGIKAKPILDIMGVVDDINSFDSQQNNVESLGFVWKGEYDIPGRRYCVHYSKDAQEGYVHLHVYARNNAEVEKRIVFRDYLRKFPDKAHEYERIKGTLSQTFSSERKSYTEGKGDFINAIVDEALAWKKLKTAC